MKIFSPDQSTAPCLLVLLLAALWISVRGASESGVQWVEDGSRYANNGAMIHDWLRSPDDLLQPFEFAKNNYAQYPAFSIPYHPPGYGFLLGVWFLVTDLSYPSARWFIGICLAATAMSFFAIVRQQKATMLSALIVSLWMISSPEIARWARSTMSEIPSLAFILAASFCYLRWLDTGKPIACWAAFGLAGMAFFCRVTSAGVLPAWILFALAQRNWPRLRSPNLLLSAVTYLVTCGAWASFSASFSQHETGRMSLAGSVSRIFALDHAMVWLIGLPNMVGWLPLIAVALSAVYCKRAHYQSAIFWVLWFACYYVFQLAVVGHYESRYFVYSVPAVFGVIAFLVDRVLDIPKAKYVVIATATCVIGLNLFNIYHMPKGLVGYDYVAEELQSMQEPGNVLLSTWWDSDLIFRYRCGAAQHRQLIRGDRTLAIRIPDYAGVEPTYLAFETDDVLEVIRQGRIRYVVTCTSYNSQRDVRPFEMALVHDVVRTHPKEFQLVKEFTLTNELSSSKRTASVFLWRFTGELEPGNSEIPVIIPTANLSIPAS